MEFWDGLWLNVSGLLSHNILTAANWQEGFATWVEYLAVDKIYPEWNIFEQFINDDFGRALQLDSLASSHPIEVPIKTAEEVDEIFDVCQSVLLWYKYDSTICI